jgi:hypothetical protein
MVGEHRVVSVSVDDLPNVGPGVHGKRGFRKLWVELAENPTFGELARLLGSSTLGGDEGIRHPQIRLPVGDL